MSDYGDVASRISVGSDILRVYPGAVVTILVSGTSTVVTQDTADANGDWEVTLDTGKYDIKIDGEVRRTFHLVKADHVHLPNEPWLFFKGGIVTADQDENNQTPICGSDVVGTIEKIIVTVQSVSASGDLTVHLLKGAAGGASILTVASDSVWNHRVFPGSAQKRYLYVDNDPELAVAADDTYTMGLDWSAAIIEGVCLYVIFRPTPA